MTTTTATKMTTTTTPMIPAVDVLQVKDRPAPSFPARHLGINTVLI